MEDIHWTHRREAVPTALLALLLVSACSDSGDPITPPPPPPPPPAATLTLTGVVTDGPIANASVLARVGTAEFAAQADEQGAYTLSIELDDALANELVLLEATGSAQQPGARFTSIAGTLSELATAAGDDEVLSGEERPALNVTNLSTAKYALLAEMNGAPVADAATLAELEPGIDGAELVRRAAAIKLVVDHPEFALPEGVEDTLALVSDGAGLATFLDAVAQIDPSALDTASAELLADRSIVRGFTAENLAPSHTLLSGYKSFYEVASVIELGENGRGSYVAYSGEDAMSWSLEDGELVILFDTGFPAEVFPINPDTGTQVRAITRAVSQRCLVLDSGAVSAPVRCHYTQLTSYPDNPELGDEITENDGYLTMPATQLDFDPAELQDHRWTMPGVFDTLPEPSRRQHAILAFQADTLGENEVSAEPFNWQLDAGELRVTYGDAEVFAYRRVLPFGPGHYTLAFQHNQAGQRLVQVALAMPVDEDLAFDADSTSGRYDNRAQHELFYRLDADGAGAVESVAADGSIFESPITAWSVSAGEVTLARPSPNWVRTWTPVQRDGDRYFLYENVRYPSGESYRRISFVDKAPL